MAAAALTSMAAPRAAAPRVGGKAQQRRGAAVVTQAAPVRPNFRVNLGAGTVTIVDEKEEAAKRALAAVVGRAGTDDAAPPHPSAVVKEREIKLRDNSNVTIAAMTEEDCIEATKLVLGLFFKVRPQDFLARERLKREQAERVYAGLVDGVCTSEHRILLVARISGRVAGLAEVSLPGGTRFGAEKINPKAPADFPYISDVAVNPNARGRGIGKALLRTCEAAVTATGHTRMYAHAKVDNEAAQALFENGGYKEPTEVTESLTQSQIAQREPKPEFLVNLGLAEVGHVLLAKDLKAKDYA